MKCKVHVGDSDLWAEYMPCGRATVAEVESDRQPVYEACAKHADEARNNGQRITWFDDDGAAA